jgi:hypothetical protein
MTASTSCNEAHQKPSAKRASRTWPVADGRWSERRATCHARRAVSVATTLALLLRFSGTSLAVTPSPSIRPGVAGLFVGEEKIVEGPVTETAREASTVRLRLGHPPQSLTVSLIIGLLSKFPPDPEHYYLGKRVRVVGTIRSFRGELEMIVHDPALIEIAGAPRAGGGSVASDTTAAGDASMRETVDALKQRVRELEEEVRQLRHPAGTAP